MMKEGYELHRLTKLSDGLKEIENVIKILDDCEIGKEDLSESFEHFKLPGIERLSYDQLDSKLKAAFTRRFVMWVPFSYFSYPTTV